MAMNLALELAHAPERQEFHNAISPDIVPFIDLHYGDTSFGTTGRVMIGYKKPKLGPSVYPLDVRTVTELGAFVTQMHISEKLDYYLTCNTIVGTQRKATNLFSLCNIVIDIDGHCIADPNERDRKIELLIERCRAELWGTEVIPAPNTIVYTGRGVQLWMALVPCYGGTKKRQSQKLLANTRRHYDRVKRIISDYYIDLLERHGMLLGLEFDSATTNNPVGYYRLPLTFNTASQTYGTYEFLHTGRYDIRELAKIQPVKKDLLFEDEPETEKIDAPKHIPMRDSDIAMVKNYAGMGFRRLRQLMDLRNLRMKRGQKIDRNYFLFSVYNSMMMYGDEDQAMEQVYAFNKGFAVPMTEDEIAGSLCTAKKKGGYKYTNAKLITFLGITEEEQAIIHLYPFVGSYDERYAKPNATRDAKRQVLKAERNHRIVEMHTEGISQAEIARRLEISKNTVGKVIKEHKAQTEDVTETKAADVQPIPAEEIGAGEERPKNGAINEIPLYISPLSELEDLHSFREEVSEFPPPKAMGDTG